MTKATAAYSHNRKGCLMRKVVPIPYPQPIPFPRLHRCAHPLRHSVLVLGIVAGWLWFSLSTRGTWGLKLARYFDPQNLGYGLPIAVFTELAWLALIPGGCLILYLVSMWHCTGAKPRPAVQQVIAETLGEPYPAQPVLVERVMLTPEEAARRGLASAVIMERIHYR
jgi:hypothetical protein